MGVVFLVAGSLGLYFGLHEALTQRRLARRGTRVGGLVVRHDRDHPGQGRSVSFAVVEFVDTRGVRHRFQSSSSGVRRLPVGGEVPVRYSPDDPNVARIDLAGRKILNVVFPLLGGAVLLSFGVLILLGFGHSSGGVSGR
ncbi:DUF3592 domain-containing protein [Streptomyces sp. DW26H14]|uniref:DUF3592 domain-containing protein n=1 Tax=Streptomyces sp. DW26H14 TaxID=3435395 RepID=UPI00403DE83C